MLLAGQFDCLEGLASRHSELTQRGLLYAHAGYSADLDSFREAEMQPANSVGDLGWETGLLQLHLLQRGALPT
jgi:hypothetical protein